MRWLTDEELTMVEMPCCDCRACKAVVACNEKTKCCQHPRVPFSELDLIAFRSGLYSQADGEVEHGKR